MKTLGVLKYLARTSTVIMTLLVMLVAVTIVQAITFSIASEMRSKRDRRARFRRQFEKRQEQLSEQDKRLRIGQDSTKVFLPDGTVHLLYTPKTLPPAREEAKVVEVYDVNLNLLWQGPKDENPHEYLSWYQMRSDDHHWRGDRVTRKLLNRIQTIGSAFSRSLEVPVGSTERIEDFETWRYNPARDIFVGYDFNSQRVGYLGPTGLAVSKAEAKPFGKFEQFTAWCPDDSRSPILLWQTEKRIYQIDLAKKQVELLFESTDSDIKEFRLQYWRFPQPKEPKPQISYRPSSICNRLLCLLMAALALWHGWPRRTSLPRLIFWLILTAAFNLAGLLTYLALNHTPLVKCSACGKRRGLQSSSCVRCGEDLPPPQPRKSDLIFDAATT